MKNNLYLFVQDKANDLRKATLEMCIKAAKINRKDHLTFVLLGYGKLYEGIHTCNARIRYSYSQP